VITQNYPNLQNKIQTSFLLEDHFFLIRKSIKTSFLINKFLQTLNSNLGKFLKIYYQLLYFCIENFKTEDFDLQLKARAGELTSIDLALIFNMLLSYYLKLKLLWFKLSSFPANFHFKKFTQKENQYKHELNYYSIFIRNITVITISLVIWVY